MKTKITFNNVELRDDVRKVYEDYAEANPRKMGVKVKEDLELLHDIKAKLDEFGKKGNSFEEVYKSILGEVMRAADNDLLEKKVAELEADLRVEKKLREELLARLAAK